MNSTTRFNPWPYAIIGTFIVFISGTVSLVVFSTRQKLDLVSADYYEQEIGYQKQMERVARTQAMPSQVQMNFDRVGQTIRIALPVDHASQHPTGWVHLYRPSSAHSDQDVALSLNAQGVHQLQAGTLAPGFWKVRVQWQVGEIEYFAEQGVVVGPAGT